MPFQARNSASDTDTDSESESDGGMQLDILDPIDGMPMEQSDLLSDGESGDGESADDGDSEPDLIDGWSLRGTSPNETGMRRHTSRSQNPNDTIYNRSALETEPLTAFEEQARMRPDFSDEKYAALAVLKSSELLMTYALANKETIPQTRRRFMAKYLEPDDPEKAEELYDPRIYIAPDGKGSEGSLIRGRVREYIGDIDDHGWHKPAHLRVLEAKKVKGGVRSGSRSASLSGANSPARNSPRRVTSGVALAAFGSRSGSASASGSPMRGRGVVDEDDEL